MRIGRLSMQILEGVLVLGLFRALFILRDPNVPHIPLIIGITMNLSFQWLLITALRKQKTNQKLSPAEQTVIINRQRGAMRILFIGAFSLFVVLMVDMGLLMSHIYSIRAFAFVALIAAALTFTFLTLRFSQLKKLQG